jgi:hypothetical protein
MNVRPLVCSFMVVCLYSSLYPQEIQVPIDQSGSILVITPDLSKELNIYSEINGFQSAKLFQVNDTLFLLEISWQQNEKSLRKREQLNSIQVSELRRKITEGINHSANINTIDQSGRSTFYNTMVGLSFGYYGWSVPLLFDNLDPRAAVGIYLFTAGGCILYVHTAINNTEMTKEGAVAFQYGATRGIIHGSALYSILTGETNESRRWFLPASSLVSIIEGMTLMSSVQTNKTPLGNIYGVGVFEDFGIGIGAGLAYLIREGDTFSLEPKDLRLLGSTVLAGSVVGYVVGKSMVGSTTYSSGDADILQSSGLLGLSMAFAIADLAGVEKPKSLVTSSMVGSMAGLAVGHLLTSTKDFSDAAGTSVRLYTSLGMIVGLGTAYALSSESSDRTIYVSLATLGAITGFTLAYSSVNAETESTTAPHTWNVIIDPIGLRQRIITSRGSEVTIFSPALRFEYKLW